MLSLIAEPDKTNRSVARVEVPRKNSYTSAVICRNQPTAGSN
jgi:hypothetical protein